MKYSFDTKRDKEEQLEHKYTHEHIKKLVNIYVNILSKYVDLEPFLDQLDFYLLERKCGYIKTKDNSKSVKDGLHISVPGFLFDNVILHKVRQKLLKTLNLLNYLKILVNKMIFMNFLMNLLFQKMLGLCMVQVKHLLTYS